MDKLRESLCSSRLHAVGSFYGAEYSQVMNHEKLKNVNLLRNK